MYQAIDNKIYLNFITFSVFDVLKIYLIFQKRIKFGIFFWVKLKKLRMDVSHIPGSLSAHTGIQINGRCLCKRASFQEI